MTRIIYRAHGQSKDEEEQGSVTWHYQLWSDLVLGGEEELAKRKAEIEAKHELGCRITGTTYPVQYFVEERDYLDYQI